MPIAPARSLRLVVHAALLVTGAATLALELIASRLLTPYVGGGLVVWTAILSVTLLALAYGYHLGSRWSAEHAGRRFARIPALAAIVLALTAALTPMLLPQLAVGGALAGAFVGVILILAPVLVLLSAMGPLAIALVSTGEGDSGAGEVFAISTVGSVAGVFIAAFALLPFMAPPATLVVLALALLAVALVAARALGEIRAVAVLLPGAIAALALAGAALFGETLMGGTREIAFGPYRVTHVATERSAHATVVVVDVTSPARQGRVRLYLEENQVQSARAEGLPGTPLLYAAIIEALVEETAPAGGRVLLLGLAGGTIASDLARAGFAVDAVDVNPDSARIAARWFDLAPEVTFSVGDARRALETCAGGYDAIVLDVYSGLEIPEHLVTRETFAAAASCLAPGGAMVVNAVLPGLDTRPTRRLLAALESATGGPIALYEDGRGTDGRLNRLLLAGAPAADAPTLDLAHYPSDLFTRTPRRLAPTVLTPADLADVAPLTDWSNDFALGIALATPAPSVFAIPASWY